MNGADEHASRPVAVVWCRQVDNEAESPGYTTVPEIFPGLKETLDTIRIVGNLTINIADTHDYWDPDPARPPLSYYPNLFLYPAYGGAYTCVGRMFLSTEDRPRLGMKTLVLDTGQLLATGEFGEAVVRWHASMGSPRTEARRPPPVPDPNIYGYLGEGLLFHRGETDPVVIVASDEWEGAMQAIFELLRRLPASLVALGAVLAFPYFLPYAKLDFREFAENLPLALALMRVPRAEALGERHKRRIESWATAPVTLRDFADGVPAPTGRTRESLPTVLQMIRDGEGTKVAPIAARVDLVELPKLRPYLADADRQAGKDRRKEMWRIGTAMESAALLLQRARGRHIPVSAETAKRAQAYLNAEPAPEEPAAPAEVAMADSPPASSDADPLTVPSWLHRPAEIAPPPTSPESVPVSVSEDPSLLAASARSAIVPAEGGAGAELMQTLNAHIEDRIRALSGEELSRQLKGLLDARLSDFARLQREAVDRAIAQVFERAQDSERRLAEDFQQKLLASDAATRRATDQLVVQEMDRRAQAAIQGILVEFRKEREAALTTAIETAVKKLRNEVATSVEDLKDRYTASEEELRSALLAQTELQIRDAQEEARSDRDETETRLKSLVQKAQHETETSRQKEFRELEQRLGLLIDGRTRDAQEKLAKFNEEIDRRVQTAAERRLGAVETGIRRDLDARLKEVEDARLQSIADLQVRMQLHLEQLMRESHEAERGAYVELLARTRSELQSLVERASNPATLEKALQEAIHQHLDLARTETERLVEQRVTGAEQRLNGLQDEATERLETLRNDIKDQMHQTSRLEQTIRYELEDLDRRVSVLSDRLVPIVKQTWLKIATLEKEPAAVEDREARTTQLRREIVQEVRRLESETSARIQDLRDRMETSIASQGKVWLTLVRQLSQLTEDRRAREISRTREISRVPAPPRGSAIDRSLSELDELSDARRGAVSAPARRVFDEDDSAPEPEEDLTDEDEEPRPRPRAGRRTATR